MMGTRASKRTAPAAAAPPQIDGVPAGQFLWTRRWQGALAAFQQGQEPPADAQVLAEQLLPRLENLRSGLDGGLRGTAEVVAMHREDLQRLGLSEVLLQALAATPPDESAWANLFDRVIRYGAHSASGAPLPRIGNVWSLAAALHGLPFATRQLLAALVRHPSGELRFYSMRNHGGLQALRQRIATAADAEREQIRAQLHAAGGQQVALDYLLAHLLPGDPLLVEQALATAERDAGNLTGELFWLVELDVDAGQARRLVTLAGSQWIYPEMLEPMALNFVRLGLPNALSLLLQLLDGSGLPVGVRRQLFAMVRAHDSTEALAALIAREADKSAQPQLDPFSRSYPVLALCEGAAQVAAGAADNLLPWLRKLAITIPAALPLALARADAAARSVLQRLPTDGQGGG